MTRRPPNHKRKSPPTTNISEEGCTSGPKAISFAGANSLVHFCNCDAAVGTTMSAPIKLDKSVAYTNAANTKRWTYDRARNQEGQSHDRRAGRKELGQLLAARAHHPLAVAHGRNVLMAMNTTLVGVAVFSDTFEPGEPACEYTARNICRYQNRQWT